MTIATKIGMFTIEPNTNGGTTIYKNGIKVCVATDIPYWDKDSLIDAIESHKELVLEKTKDEMSFITKDNVKDALVRIADVLGKDERGFYASRLKQCINKMK